MDRFDPAAEPHLIFDIENEDRREFSVVFVHFMGYFTMDIYICLWYTIPRIWIQGVFQMNAGKLAGLKPASVFAFFQFLMPLIGYFLAVNFAEMIEAYDHWIAFILLLMIGGKMIYDGMEKEKVEISNENRNKKK